MTGRNPPGAEPGLPPMLVNAREASKAMGICERTLWHLTHRAGLPHVRIGRAVRYDPRDLSKWIARRKQGGTP